MSHLWIILILLHHASALLSVTRGQLGEPVTFTCSFPDLVDSSVRVKWYKQRIGDTLKLITTLMKATDIPKFEQGFSQSRFDANSTNVMSTLTILATNQEDEALYYCAAYTWSKDQWNGTYLSLNENAQRGSDYTVFQLPTVTDPVQPGDSVTLQCSIGSSSGESSCPEEHSIHWFGARSDQSFANVIYTDGKGSYECNKKPESPSHSRSCVYRFSKNITSSDTGTFYCALVTCGEIIFGDGTKLNIKGNSLGVFGGLLKDDIIPLLMCTVLAISVIVIGTLIYIIKHNKCDCNASISLKENIAKTNIKREKEMSIYSAVIFTMIKNGSGGRGDTKAMERERIYAAVKAFGVD
ncbi:uncharacterized protein LOC115786405 [Archocentrus centrarchus]|uniref:uncharacterized protein LOC115786405 n=1 Tax=Archocentrus centrarchus TaxID=63155 RepID=UPI0011EA3C1F|nr:uncharacterized protein LOC115786405 [Archocentrus centrarchus]